MSLSSTGLAMWNSRVSTHSWTRIRCVEVKHVPDGSRREIANWIGLIATAGYALGQSNSVDEKEGIHTIAALRAAFSMAESNRLNSAPPYRT